MLTLNVNVTFFNVNVNAPLTPPTLPRPSSARMARARPAAERRSEGAGLARGMRVEVGACFFRSERPLWGQSANLRTLPGRRPGPQVRWPDCPGSVRSLDVAGWPGSFVRGHPENTP